MFAVLFRGRMRNFHEVVVELIEVGLSQCNPHGKNLVLLNRGPFPPSMRSVLTLLMKHIFPRWCCHDTDDQCR